MLTFLKGLLQHTYDVSEREPLWTSSTSGIGQFVVYGMAFEFWFQMALSMFMTGAINTLAAVVIYFSIIPNRGSVYAYCVGWGVIIPAAWYITYHLTKYLDIPNTAVLMGFMATPTYVPFRCIECEAVIHTASSLLSLRNEWMSYMRVRCVTAMYGTSPRFAEESLGLYIFYHAFPIPLNFDSKTGKLVRATSHELRTKLYQLGLTFAVTVLLFNILEETNYAPFPVKRPANSFFDLFYWGNILNNYAVACKSRTYLLVAMTKGMVSHGRTNGVSVTRYCEYHA